jgi:hypothetical protein
MSIMELTNSFLEKYGRDLYGDKAAFEHIVSKISAAHGVPLKLDMSQKSLVTRFAKEAEHTRFLLKGLQKEVEELEQRLRVAQMGIEDALEHMGEAMAAPRGQVSQEPFLKFVRWAHEEAVMQTQFAAQVLTPEKVNAGHVLQEEVAGVQHPRKGEVMPLVVKAADAYRDALQGYQELVRMHAAMVHKLDNAAGTK